ncbi:MAG: Fic family protein [Armatimonadota bacterium]|nr:Fic family protein [Armatimonadota bacterium]
MRRYTSPVGVEAEYEPGSRGRVLRNKLGIKRVMGMHSAEYEALVAAQKLYYAKMVDEKTSITAEFIRSMHRDWLGGIYEWAGDYRTVELEKEGFPWPPAYLVPDNMSQFERDVLNVHTPCRHTELADVCRSVAIVHADLLLIHPFREGNGRLARWLADIMVAQAGYPLPEYRFEGIGSRSEKERYLSAVVNGYSVRYDDLAGFFEETVRLRLEE